MSIFRIFVAILISLYTTVLFSANDGETVENNANIASWVDKLHDDKTKVAQKKIVENKNARKQIFKQRAYNLSELTINPGSPMCQYAKKNDIIALKKALSKSNYSFAEVNTVCKNDESLFLIAVNNDNYLAAKLLLEKGANVNLQNKAGVSVLHIIARCNTENMSKIFNLMLKKNVHLNLNVKDLEGYTPLMRAVEFEKIQIIKTLVKNGADLNVKNNYGYSAIELARLALNGKKTDKERSVSEEIIDILNNNE